MPEPPSRARTLVVGEALIDLIAAPDGALVAVPGGGPYNTARTIARLGQPVAYLGRLSTDRFGATLLANLRADGVDLAGIAMTDDPTTLAVADLDEHGTASYRFYLDGTSAPGLRPADVATAWDGQVAALHVGTLGLALEPIGDTVEQLVANAPPSVLVMLDPNSRPSATRDPAAFRARIARMAARADVVKVSDDDLRFLDPRATPEAAIDRLLSLGTRVVLRTDGGRAVEVRTSASRVEVPVPTVAVVDTVGAGDAFGGGFLAAWIGARRGRADLATIDHVLDAVRFAVRVASLTCTRPGADPPTLADVGGPEA